MGKNVWKAKCLGLLSAAAVILLALSAYAGTLDPTGNPADGSAMPALQGIYDQLNSGTPAGNSSSFQEPANGPTAGTGKTLNDIKAKLPALDDTNGAAVGEVLSGKTFWGLKNGQWGVQTGTVPAGADIQGSNGQLTITVPFGQYTGSTSTMAIDTNLIPGNIRSGATIFGVSGKAEIVDTSGATAVSSHMLSGDTAYVNGSLVTGSVPSGSNIAGGDGLKTITITQGLYTGAETVTANDANLTAAKIKCGETIFGVTGVVPPGCVPKTGQTAVYAAGDDGTYQKGCSPTVAFAYGTAAAAGAGYNRTSFTCTPTKFIDNGDGTVTDNLTGLIWLKNANCFGSQTWASALTSANTLATGACGLSDGSAAGNWRLPNINELRSLIDPARMNTVLPSGHPFTGVQS